MPFDFSASSQANPDTSPQTSATTAPTETWIVSDYPATQTPRVRWSPENVIWNSDGSFDLVLQPSAPGSARPFTSGEVATVETAMSGTWEWTLQAPDMVDGSVLGMFLFQADPRADRVEFDLELVGADSTEIELNVHMQTASGVVMLAGGPRTVDLGFDASEGQHTYRITVTGDEATFFADGRELGSFTAADMPQGAWGQSDLRAYTDLWPVAPGGQENWAGVWAYPGQPMVAHVTAMGLVGGTAPAPGGMTGDATANAITGTAMADLIDGMGGNDTLTGNAGDDTILGGAGDDRLIGGDGNDTLFMDEGNDLIDGGNGIDWLAVAGAVGVTITLGRNSRDAHLGTDTILNVENVVGSAGNDTITGDHLANILLGGAGDDVLSGGAGDDVLDGGTGRDQLGGGSGADVFYFRNAGDSARGQADTITDFRTGQDHIDLSDLDLTWANGPTANGVWIEQLGRNSLHLLADTDGDGTADFEILFANNARFTASDLIL